MSAATETPARASRAPDAKDESANLALWKETTGTGKTFYKIAEGKKGETKTYTTVYPEVNGVTITPAEALALYKGDTVAVEMEGGKGTYDCHLAMREIRQQPWKKDPTKYDNIMSIAMAIPLTKQATGEMYGWTIDRIRVFQTIGRGPDAVTLEARDAVRLLGGETLEGMGPNKDTTLKLDGVMEEIHEGRTYKNARIGSSKGPAETLPTPEVQPEVGRAARAKV